MDGATAAVLAGLVTALGAVGGALATAFATHRQAKLQVQSAAQLQLREPRKQTYSDFIHACRKVRDELFGRAEEETGEIDNGVIHTVIEGHFPDLERAFANVELEGPDEVVATARSVIDEINEAYLHDLSIWLSGVEERGKVPRVAGERLDAFITAARTALSTHAD